MRKQSFAISVGVFVLAGLSIAQVSSRLSGLVTDPTGAAVPSATVDLFLPGGAKPLLTSTTTGDGLFAFSGAPIGVYDVVVSAAGFKKRTERGVVLNAGQETALGGIRLEVGSIAETVEVTVPKINVQTDNAEISNTISHQQVQDLPILNRSPQGFVDTQAGVTLGRGGDSVINGQRTSFTNVTLDGINIQDNYIRTNAVDFSPNLLLLDQVGEMTLSTSNTNPSAGGGASQVIFVTPSGTNNLHGSGFWSNRNSDLAANTWFNNQARVARPFLNQNQTGGSLGGPIKKDKLFFYVNYELFLLCQQSGQQRTILTPDATQGIFTYINSAGATQKVNILQAAGQVQDPTVAALIKRIPTQFNNFNSGDTTASLVRNTAGYLFNQRSNRTRDNVTGKIDYVLSPKNSITGTYAWNSDYLDRPDVNTVGYSAAPLVQNNDKVNFFSSGWRYSPKPTLTNEVRFGFNLAPALFISTENFGTSILAGTVFSTPVATFRSQGRYTDTYNLADNASFVHGAHNVQFGFQMQKDYTEPYNDAGITPTYTLGISSANSFGLTNTQLPGASSTDVAAANNLLGALAGFVSSYSQTFNVKTQTSGYVPGQTQDRHWKLNNYSGYVLDTWKVRRNLTLNLGMRWEYYSPVQEQNGLALLPQLVNNNVFSTLYSNATLGFAKGGLANRDLNNFGPNIGLAWDPFGKGRTSIRAGYSINYVNDEYLVAITGNANTNAGLSQSVTNPTALSSLVSSGLPSIVSPTFQVPRQFSDNYNLSPTSSFGMPDPNLRSPYVQQWNIGIQHELKNLVVEARYVGNHGTKLLRAIDLNQININASGFLADFQRAQANGNLALSKTGTFNPAYDPTIAGSQVLTVFPTMPNGGTLTNATNRTFIQQGAVADMAYNYQSTKANGPVAFFQNPYATSLRLMTNFSNSDYNGAQFEIRSRDWRGLTLQANYTYSKALSDADSGSDNNNQGRFEPLMDNNNPKLEKARALFDLTHVARFNYVYRLPMGTGHHFGYKPLNHYVLDGWQVSGIFNRQSGEPYSICSGIGTFNRNNILATNTCNTADTSLNMGQLRDDLQFRMTGSGPFMSAASITNTSGQAAVAGGTPFSGQIFTTASAGTIGQLQKRQFDGPFDTTFDFGASKTTHITEHQTILLRLDASNFLNHPSFALAGDQTVTSTTFGKITGTFAARRQIQFTLQYRF